MDPFEVMQKQINTLRQEVRTLRSQQVLRGEVRSVDPLRISLDLDPETVLADAPENIAPWLNTGDFVYCQLVEGRLIILGRTGAPVAADWDTITGLIVPPEPDIMVVTGKAYQASGVLSVPNYSLKGSAPNYYAAMDLTMPFTPPAGWRFTAHIHRMAVFPSAMAILGDYTGNVMSVMFSATRGRNDRNPSQGPGGGSP